MNLTPFLIRASSTTPTLPIDLVLKNTLYKKGEIRYVIISSLKIIILWIMETKNEKFYTKY